jgi:hypothetical protein
MSESLINFQSKDGLQLEGTLRITRDSTKIAILFVHGITVDREEDGFYTQFAKKMDDLSAMSFRFDLRGHGTSQGKYEDLTLAGVINDIDSAVNEIRVHVPIHVPLVIIAASFSGGLASNWALKNSNKIHALVLLNPLLDYGEHMLFSKGFWENDQISFKGNEILKTQGWLPHGEFRMGSELIDELSNIQSFEKMGSPSIPILVIHGNKDCIVPFEIAQKYSNSNQNSTFVTINGADHGFTSPNDDNLSHPDTIHFRDIIFKKVIKWISELHE